MVQQFSSALDAHSGGQACSRLSPALRGTLEQEHSMAPCAAAIATTKTRGASVAAVHVYATSARADLADGQSVYLSAMRDGWKIDAFGCRPRASGPYNCEEQS